MKLDRLSLLLLALAIMASFAACVSSRGGGGGGDDDDSAGDDDDSEFPGETLRPTWNAKEEFVIEAKRRLLPPMTERGPHTLDPAADEVGSTMDASDPWSDPVWWLGEVLQTGLSPAEGDPLYDAATRGGAQSTLTVLKFSLHPALNIGGAMLEMDPKLYLVVRDDSLKVTDQVAFWTKEGVRRSEAWTVGALELDGDSNRLGQSSLFVTPCFLPPGPVPRQDGTTVLANGQRVTVTGASETSLVVTFDDMISGNPITQTLTAGMPWAELTSTDSLEARLLSDEEVEELADDLAGRSDEEDDDFVTLLDQGVDLGGQLSVDALLGTHSYEVPEGDRPWAGSWWRQSEGALAFGFLSGEDNTVSQLQRDVFISPATDIQNLGDELRDLRLNGLADSTEYTEKVEEYRAAQQTLRDSVVDYYNAVRSGIDGGQIAIDAGRLMAGTNWHANYEAFDVEIDKLSPLDKFSLLQQVNGNTSGSNPWFAPAWEALNHWSPAGSTWFGHCNGWSAAAILTNEPRESHTVEFSLGGTHTMELSVGDQKGLLSESYYGVVHSSWGSRYRGEATDVIEDLSPVGVLTLLYATIAAREEPLVFDTSANEEVWNYPAWAYELTLSETGSGAGDVRQFSGELSVQFATDGVGYTHVDSNPDNPNGFVKHWFFTLEASPAGEIISGSWDDDVNGHPDFAWRVWANSVQSSSEENPYLQWIDLKTYLPAGTVRF